MDFTIIGKMSRTEPKGCKVVLREKLTGTEFSAHGLLGDPDDENFVRDCRIFMNGVAHGIRTVISAMPNPQMKYEFEDEDEQVKTLGDLQQKMDAEAAERTARLKGEGTPELPNRHYVMVRNWDDKAVNALIYGAHSDLAMVADHSTLLDDYPHIQEVNHENGRWHLRIELDEWISDDLAKLEALLMDFAEGEGQGKVMIFPPLAADAMPMKFI